MFVNQVDLEEFRGVSKCQNPLVFADFTALVGRNNSGKTSVLEALSLLPTPHYGLPYYVENRVQFLSKLHSGKPSLIYAYSGSASIKYKIRGIRSEKSHLLTWQINLNERGIISLLIEGIEPNKVVNNPLAAANQALGIKPKKRIRFSGADTEVIFIPNNTWLRNLGLTPKLQRN